MPEPRKSLHNRTSAAIMSGTLISLDNLSNVYRGIFDAPIRPLPRIKSFSFQTVSSRLPGIEKHVIPISANSAILDGGSLATTDNSFMRQSI
jgi:hypothetical protein